MSQPLTSEQKREKARKTIAAKLALPDPIFSVAEAATYISFSTNWLFLRRQAGLCPEFIEPTLPPGTKRANHHIRYRKSDLDDCLPSKLGGLKAIAPSLPPVVAQLRFWAADESDRLLGDAFDLIDADAIGAALEANGIYVGSLYEALQEPWASASGKRAATVEYLAALQQMGADAQASSDDADLRDGTPSAAGGSAPGLGRGRI